MIKTANFISCTWHGALETLNTINLMAHGGYTDWRLPRAWEIVKLIELKEVENNAACYWTASEDLLNDDILTVKRVIDGILIESDRKSNRNIVFFVRGEI